MRRKMGAAKFAGALCLLGAAFVWGMSFPAQSAASEVVGSFTFIAGKSTIAGLFMVALIAGRAVVQKRRAAKRPPSAGASAVASDAATGDAPAAGDASAAGDAPAAGDTTPPRKATTPASTEGSPARGAFSRHKHVILGGILCGVVLFMADNCQQFGIGSYPADAAASGRAGFLTATYVVIVAVLARFMGRKLHPAVIVAVFVCLAGMYLLCVPPGSSITSVYLGDAVMLCGALFYAFHILAVGRFALEDALWLSCAQFFTSATLSAVCAGVIEHASPADVLPALVPMLYVGVFSTGLGYTLQNIGQRTVAEAPAAILMSLESVFAALGGWVLLGERLSAPEMAGCALVFAAVLLAQLPMFKQAARSS